MESSAYMKHARRKAFIRLSGAFWEKSFIPHFHSLVSVRDTLGFGDRLTLMANRLYGELMGKRSGGKTRNYCYLW